MVKCQQARPTHQLAACVEAGSIGGYRIWNRRSTRLIRGCRDGCCTRQPEDSIEAQIARLQAEAAAAINRAGLQQDPYRHVIEAATNMLGTVPRLAHELREARLPLSRSALHELHQAAAQGASEQAHGIVRAVARQWAVFLVLGGIALAVISGGIGYATGKRYGLVAVAPFAAMTPADAAAWARLIRDNQGSIRGSVELCEARTASTGGRKSCSLPVWWDEPHTSPTS